MTREIAQKCRVLVLAAALAAGCDRESGTAGIDGTGVRAPSVVYAYGRVAQFGSIWINGVRYDTSGATFTINGRPGSLADLDINDIVLVEGELEPSASSGAARSVLFDHVLVGSVAAVDTTDGSFVALGQTVNVAADTSFDAAMMSGLLGVAVGDVINVSGFRTIGGTIVATRIGRQTPGVDELKTTGAVTNVASEGKRFSINALIVDYSTASLAGLPGRAIAHGDIVEVKGSLLGADGELLAASVELKEKALPGRVGDRVDIEGYVTRVDRGGPLNFEVAGLPVTMTSETEGWPTLDAAIEVEGSLDSSGVVVASEVKTGFVPALGSYTVEGRVFDPYTGAVAGAAINFWVQNGMGGYSYWWAHHPLFSDETGRFTAENLPDSRITIQAVMPSHPTAPTFVQPCAVILDVRENLAVNVEMTSASTLSSLNPPRPQSAREPTLTGTIFEMTDTGRQPVAGARLWAEHPFEVGFATTLSDLQGGYFLCNMPPETDLWVTKAGYENTVIWKADTSRSRTLDIELKRK